VRPFDPLHSWFPRWWRGEAGSAAGLLHLPLLPLEFLYRSGVALRDLAYDRGLLASVAAAIPVVSVGNLSVGGTGKTPITAEIARYLGSRGRLPAIVMRGYGWDEVEVHRALNPAIPVIAAKRRAEGVARAVAGGCDCVVLDDGFQHRSLRRDLDIVLVAAEVGERSHRLLPRGPWREPPTALDRAGALVVTRKSAGLVAAERVLERYRRYAPHAVVAIACLKPTTASPLRGAAGDRTDLDQLRDLDVVALTTLADPAPFHAQLRELGARIETIMSFPDHHEFSGDDLDRIRSGARGRPIVVTRKEAVKIPEDMDVPVWVVDQRVEFEEGEANLHQAIDAAVGRGR
jgi:tetraacyldisaccharide 4'-kinase